MQESRQERRIAPAQDKALDAFRCLIQEIVTKLAEIEQILKTESDRMVISYVTSRIKTPDSIAEKLDRKGKKGTWEAAVENLNDIAGVRAVCLFEEDIYRIRDFFCRQETLRVVREKDFIRKPKASGYRSLHLILEPAGCPRQPFPVRAELQLRTMAMDFWSVLEYQLQYKKKNQKTREAQEQLKACAADIRRVEAKMYDLKKKIDRMS